MGLESVQPSIGPQTPADVGRTGHANGPRLNSDESSGGSVRLSDQGRKLSKLAGLLDPTHENLRKLSTTLAGNLKRQLGQNGIDPRGEIGFEVDSQTGKVDIKGNRPDVKKISALLESQPELERQVQDVAALSRQVIVSEQDARSGHARQSAQRAAWLSSFAATYASRFGNGSESGDFSRIANLSPGSAAGLSRGIATYTAMSTVASVSLVYDGADIHVRS
jgi:hypothetical protein